MESRLRSLGSPCRSVLTCPEGSVEDGNDSHQCVGAGARGAHKATALKGCFPARLTQQGTGLLKSTAGLQSLALPRTSCVVSA